jgi:hypothetical protein
MDERQDALLSRLVSFLLCIHNNLGSEDRAMQPQTLLMAEYVERWVNALVYELFFPERLHSSDLYFFEITQRAQLNSLSGIEEGHQLRHLHSLFEELYTSSHPLRQALFSLDSVEEVRIIEGKA